MSEQEKAREIARLLLVWADGKTLQQLLCTGKWEDYTNPECPGIYAIAHWRVKPEPKTWWIRMQNGRVISVQDYEPSAMFPDGQYIKVQEVLP